VTDEAERARADRAERIPPTPGQFWRAVGIGTALATASFWVVFVGAVAISGDAAPGPMTLGGLGAWGGRFNGDASASYWFGAGLALMPVAFFLMARMTMRPFRGLQVANASVLAVALWVWLPVLSGEPLTPTVAAFGAGGAVVLGYRYVKRVSYRVVAVGFVAVYVFLFFGMIPWVALMVGPLAPLPAIGWADHIAARRARQLQEREAMKGERTSRPASARSGGSRRRRGNVTARQQAPQRRGRSSVKRRR
jgi:hypothetical protein